MYVARIPLDGGLGGRSDTGSPDTAPAVPTAPGVGSSPPAAADQEDEPALPCHSEDPDLWFAEHTAQLRRAQDMCQGCPIRRQCLEGALERREPWGVWGGQIFERGRTIPFKRGRGRPSRRPIEERTVA